MIKTNKNDKNWQSEKSETEKRKRWLAKTALKNEKFWRKNRSDRKKLRSSGGKRRSMQKHHGKRRRKKRCVRFIEMKKRRLTKIFSPKNAGKNKNIVLKMAAR